MEKTVEENNISSKRLTYCLGMGLLFLAGQVLLCLGQEILLDQLLCLVTLDISFFLIFVLALMKHRLLGELPQKQSASYQKVFLSPLRHVMSIILPWVKNLPSPEPETVIFKYWVPS